MSSPLSPLPLRRRALACVGAAVIGLTLSAAVPAGATAAPVSSAHDRATFLIAADPTAQALHVYRAADLERTGSLDGVEVDVHAGTVPLPDGRVLLVDEEANVHAVRISAAGRPRVERTVAIPHGDRRWNGAAWAAIDPSLRYYAVTSAYEDSPDQTVTVVDTRTFRAYRLPVTVDEVDGDYTEVQVSFGGRPTQIVTAAGGAFRTYPLADVLAGRTPEATSSAPLGRDNHGPVVSRSGDRHFSTTRDGIDGAALPGRRLVAPTSVPYSLKRDVVQAWRPRWAADDRSIWSSVSEEAGLEPEQWADTRNDVHVLDTAARRSTLTRLPDGLPGRLALSTRYAAVTTQSAEGDTTTLVDADPRSSTHRRVVGTVALPALAGGPVDGTPADGAATRATAITPSGDLAFVTAGGEGRIMQIDTRLRRITRTVTAPTALRDVHLSVIRLGAPVTDLIAR